MLLIGAGALLAACGSAPPGPESGIPTPETPSASATASADVMARIGKIGQNRLGLGQLLLFHFARQ